MNPTYAYKNPTVAYFSIFNGRKPQKFLRSAYLMEDNISHTLVLLSKQYKQPSRTLAVRKP